MWLFPCCEDSFPERGTTKGIGAEDASLQKLLDLQYWPRNSLVSCTHPRPDDPGQGEHAALPVDLFRLLYLLGIDNDCPIHLSAAKALEVSELKLLLAFPP